jgi:glutamine synthetase
MAATLAAGMDGVDRGLDPGEVGSAKGPDLPPTLLHAVDALESDPVVAGALGPEVSAYFADLKREEFLDWHATVSPAEVDRYLTAF